MTVLSVRELSITRGHDAQSFRISLPELTLGKGDIVAVTGPSGCGKSTLIETLGLILAPTHVGSFALHGKDITSLVRNENKDHELAGLRSQFYGFVPQTHGLLPYLTVQQNLALQARITGKAINTDWLDQASRQLGINDLCDRLPKQLSIGQRQRVSFLRALSHQPSLLLADEPTAALDPAHARGLFELMLDQIRDLGTTMIVVTHEWDLVRTLGLQQLVGESVAANEVEFV